VDEVLSVGDIEFQQKCMGRIRTFLARGATLLLVTHSPDLARELCQRVVWMDAGRVVMDGPTAEVLDAYVTRAAPALRTAI
jgi:ABC-type polysaccharide/polyol phosphate transport system ATPase subunit